VEFIAKNQKVIIKDGEKELAELSVYDARNPFVSFELDEARTEITRAIDAYDKFSKINREKIDKNDPSIMNDLLTISGHLHRTNIEYLKKCIMDISNYMEILKRLNGEDMGKLQATIQRAQFGLEDTGEKEVKKKRTSRTISKNSNAGDTQNQKLEAGTTTE
jgi:hypothetical protein